MPTGGEPSADSAQEVHGGQSTQSAGSRLSRAAGASPDVRCMRGDVFDAAMELPCRLPSRDRPRDADCRRRWLQEVR
eukprot:1960381-Lingulodinium_polyedra.AAC.1